MTKEIMKNDAKKPKLQKQNAERDDAAQQVERDGYTAEEIGEQSSYEDETETARRMRRGDETKGDPDERDIAGAVDSEDVSPEISPDRKPAKQ